MVESNYDDNIDDADSELIYNNYYSVSNRLIIRERFSMAFMLNGLYTVVFNGAATCYYDGSRRDSQYRPTSLGSSS